MGDVDGDRVHMLSAIEAAAEARCCSSPNPWVGAVVVVEGEVVGQGSTQPPGGDHAEKQALAEAGEAAKGATLYTTLEPCPYLGRTRPCTEAILEAGISRVVVGIVDPDERVLGRGISVLRDAGIEVAVGVRDEEVSEQLAPYLHHRSTGRPYVVMKLAATVDGRIAAPDRTSSWITGPEARADVHRLRAESDAVCVGAGTVRTDDPRLTVRDWPAGVPIPIEASDPRRIVFGTIPDNAKVLPAQSHEGELTEILDQLGGEGVLQLLVEGGADVAGRFHRAGLVDHYVIYVAPSLLGGDDGRPLLAGSGAPTMADVRRGRFTAVTHLGDDLRIDLILNS